MRRAQMLVRDADRQSSNAVRDASRQYRQPLDNGSRTPRRHHFHADRRHFHGDEMIALAHVVAARVGLITGVGKVHRVLRLDVAATERCLLERHTALVTLGDVDEGATVGTEHPLVGRKNQEIGIEALDVGRQHADAMRRIDEKRRALPLQRHLHTIDVDEATIRPMHRRDRGERQRRCSRSLDRGKNGARPVAV